MNHPTDAKTEARALLKALMTGSADVNTKAGLDEFTRVTKRATEAAERFGVRVEQGMANNTSEVRGV